MPKTTRCNLLALAAPYATEKRVFAPRPPIVAYEEPRLAAALRQTKLVAAPVCVGDGVYASYADVFRCDRDRVCLGMIVAGPFASSRRLFALALARDIVQRGCGAVCTADAICCEAGGVRFVSLPADYLVTARRLLDL